MHSPPLVITNDLHLGVHRGFNKGHTLYDRLSDDIGIRTNVTQIFLSETRSLNAPRRFTPDDIKRSSEWISTYDVRVYSHFPYIANFASPDASKAILRLQQEIMEMKKVNAVGVVVHPGTQTVNGQILGTPDNIIANISKITPELQSHIVLENSAGEGKKLFSTMEEIHYIMRNLPNVKLCMDTAHAFGRGMSTFKKKVDVLRFFVDIQQTIGLNRLSLIHLNDSCAEYGSRKDHHNRIGYGYIWGEDISSLTPLLSTCAANNIAIVGENSIDAFNDIPKLRKIYNATL
jgi:deoxyribonuclease-4